MAMRSKAVGDLARSVDQLIHQRPGEKALTQAVAAELKSLGVRSGPASGSDPS